MSDEIFDPEIHSADKDGNPTLNKDGTFRKKRRDAGKTTKGPAPVSSGGKILADQRAGYVKAVHDVLEVVPPLLSMVDPVDGYCALGLVDPWSEVIGDLAMEYPQLAAALERSKVAGPLLGVVGLGLLTVVQFGHNHNKIPEGLARMVGARPRSEVEQLLRKRGVQLAAEAEERKRQDAEDQAMSDAYVVREEDTGVAHEYAAA